jgi:hypothetical protein
VLGEADVRGVLGAREIRPALKVDDRVGERLARGRLLPGFEVQVGEPVAERLGRQPPVLAVAFDRHGSVTLASGGAPQLRAGPYGEVDQDRRCRLPGRPLAVAGVVPTAVTIRVARGVWGRLGSVVNPKVNGAVIAELALGFRPCIICQAPVQVEALGPHPPGEFELGSSQERQRPRPLRGRWRSGPRPSFFRTAAKGDTWLGGAYFIGDVTIAAVWVGPE